MWAVRLWAALSWRKVDPDNLFREEFVLALDVKTGKILQGKLKIDKTPFCESETFAWIPADYYIPVSELLKLPKEK